MSGSSLRILQVNKQDRGGGAAQISWNLHQAYQQRGIYARMAVQRKTSTDTNVFEIPHHVYKPGYTRLTLALAHKLEHWQGSFRGKSAAIRLLYFFTRYSQNLNLYLGKEDYSAPGTWHLLELPSDQVNILHCHNLHRNWLQDRREFFDLRALPWLSQRVPVVLTLHDAWLISGHCSHSFGCERWRVGCGHCPDLNIYPAIRRDSTAYNWERKRSIFSHSRLHISAPSQWLMEKVTTSILATAAVTSRVIPNGVDLSVFHPGHENRAALSLPPDARVLLFSAYEPRRNADKDYQTLYSAVVQAAEHVSNVIFIVLGGEGQAERSGQAEIRFISYENDPEMVARYYRAADVYVHAAKADTFPNSVLEALACGKPVIATDVGGIPEQVIEGKTGFLIKPKDTLAMAKKIEQLLIDSETRERMGYAALDDAHKRFDLNRQVMAYLDFYQEAIESTKLLSKYRS